jgi:NADPH-ferrihemoprotein reductase
LKAQALDLDDHEHEHLPEVSENKLLIFIVSTFGVGEPTDNSFNFLTSIAGLKSSVSTDNKKALNHLRYMAFGLGNRNYKQYNKIIDVIDETYQSLGATRVGEVGKADEARGGMATEEDFLEWKESALNLIQKKFSVEERPIVFEPELEVTPLTVVRAEEIFLGEPNAEHLPGKSTGKVVSSTNPHYASVVVARDIVNEPGRKIIHLELDISKGKGMKYQSGDHLAVWPVNPDAEVERLCKLLGLSSEARAQAIEIRSKQKSNAKALPVSSPTTRETVLRYYLEICGPVSPDILRLLAAFAPSEQATDTLMSLANNKEQFRQMVSSRCLNVGKAMEMAGGDATWSKVPFSLLVECVGKLQPRYYSIASSPSVAPQRTAITVSITNKLISAEDPESHLQGVASNYLLAMKHDLSSTTEEAPNPSGLNHLTYSLTGPRPHTHPSQPAQHKVLVHLRRSTFKLPPNPKRPIILIAAGTGIAPFRAFIQERAAMSTIGSMTFGPMLFLFGCRGPREFLYESEFRAAQESLPGLEIHAAFSRHGETKQYVQDKFYTLRKRVTELLEDGAALYICGSADMAREVREVLTKIVAEGFGWDDSKAEKYISGDMKREKRLQEDVWSS